MPRLAPCTGTRRVQLNLPKRIARTTTSASSAPCGRRCMREQAGRVYLHKGAISCRPSICLPASRYSACDGAGSTQAGTSSNPLLVANNWEDSSAESLSSDTGQVETGCKGRRLRIRRARESDTSRVAELCAEVFGPLTFYGFPAVLQPSTKLSQQAGIEIQKDVNVQLLRSMKAKQSVSQLSRSANIHIKTHALSADTGPRVQAPAAQCNDEGRNRPLGWEARLLCDNSNAHAEGDECRKALLKWKQSRQFVCIIAFYDSSPQSIAGCAVISLATPEALLPPPWPSSAPLRCCVSNLAVATQYRRQGVARRMLKNCERLARKWGFEDLWLHTEVRNTAATQLYLSLGYKELKRDPAFFGPFQRILFRKQLAPLCPGKQDAVQAAELNSGRCKNGTYMWDVTRNQM